MLEAATGMEFATWVRKSVWDPVGAPDAGMGGTTLDERLPGEVRYYGRYWPDSGKSQATSVMRAECDASGITTSTDYQPYAYFNLSNSLPGSGVVASGYDLALLLRGVFAPRAIVRGPRRLLTDAALAELLQGRTQFNNAGSMQAYGWERDLRVPGDARKTGHPDGSNARVYNFGPNAPGALAGASYAFVFNRYWDGGGTTIPPRIPEDFSGLPYSEGAFDTDLQFALGTYTDWAEETSPVRSDLPFLALLLAACTSPKPGDSADTPTSIDSATDSQTTDSSPTDTGTAPCVSSEPCDCGVAWTERRGPTATIQESLIGARSGETVEICAGEHHESFEMSAYALDGWKPGDVAVMTLRGAGMDSTTLTVDPEEDFPVSVAGLSDMQVTISDLTISGGSGEPTDCDDFSCQSSISGGVEVYRGTFYFDRVRITDNSAGYGGALALFGGSTETPDEVVLTDSEVIDNRTDFTARYPLSGGAVWLMNSYRLESIRTDWGTAATDNDLDDIAIYTSAREVISYDDFGADESFVCSSETESCVRTE